MKILAIETSCDDTCIAVLEAQNLRFKIKSNIVSSQVKLHAKYGGVYPTLAKREHQKNLPIVLKRALKEAGSPKINLIAVTVGPGLEPCLWTGVNFAKDLAQKMNLPILPVNHIEAHIATNFIGGKSKKILPAVCLVVSGGHTQLILMERIGKYKVIGQTRDDAAGECFDKTARILGLGYPGGPAIAVEAAKYPEGVVSRPYGAGKIQLPRPMIYQKNYDFSFSGLKTAVLYDFKKRIPEVKKSKSYMRQMCSEIQQAAIDVLIHKTLKAARNFKAKTIILGGGVAANKELREQLRKRIEKEMPSFVYHVPDQKHCTDNALMTAVTAYYRRKEKTKNWKNIKADANLRIDQKYGRETC